MKAELVKRQDRWDLYGEDGSKIASSAPNPFKRLSIKNCQAIENGYDLDELVKNMGKEFYVGGNYDFENGVKEGFLKALKILGDKKFTLNELLSFADHVKGYNETTYSHHSKEILDEWLLENSISEWDVEIVTKPYTEVSEGFELESKREPKLDAENCLILKRL